MKRTPTKTDKPAKKLAERDLEQIRGGWLHSGEGGHATSDTPRP